MRFRFYYAVHGGHTHVRVFAGRGEFLGKCGDLVFRNDEWEVFNQRLFNLPNIEVIPEGSQS